MRGNTRLRGRNNREEKAWGEGYHGSKTKWAQPPQSVGCAQLALLYPHVYMVTWCMPEVSVSQFTKLEMLLSAFRPFVTAVTK